MDMERLSHRYRQAQRATVARSALDVIAIIFLIAGFAFWGVAFWQLLNPPALLSLLSIQSVVLALVFSLAAPLLISMLVPTTPAGQMLQRTQWGTVGFYVILAAGLYLAYQSEQMIEIWLYNQPAIAAAGWERRLAITLTIAFVVIPALAWVQLTPERWTAAVQQAHAVKKLEMQQRGELAILKASIVRASSLAAIGWANLLPIEKEEAIASVRGLLMASSDSMRTVVRTLGLSAEMEREIMGDEEIAQQLEYVKNAIDVLPDLNVAPRESTILAVQSADRAAPAATAAHVDSRLQSSIPREPMSDDVGQGPIESDSVARRIASELPRIFTAQNLADLVQQDKRTAQRTIATWLDDGIIEQVQLGRYALKRGT